MNFINILIGDVMKIFLILFRTIVFYIAITLLYRIMGKREIGELKVADLVVSLLLSNIAAMGIEDYEENIFVSLLPVVMLVGLQIATSRLTLKYTKVRKAIDGEVSVIINRGKVNFKEMLKQRYNLDDLLMELRSQGIKSIEDVDYAILEVSGRLSVFEKDEDDSYPLPLILNGKIDEDVLVQIGKDEEWLNKVLKDEGYSLDKVFYGFYKDNQVFFIKNESIK